MLVVADAVARHGLADLVAGPGVTRVGLALVEGGGRRLKFTASDRQGEVVDWCHIDAYDDVPLNAVVRSGSRLAGSWDELAPRFPQFVARQRGGTTTGLVAEPLVVHGQVLGAVVAYLDDQSVAEALPVETVDTLARDLRAAQARLPRPDGALADREVAEGALVADCEVEGQPQAVGTARRFVRRQLAAWGIDDDVIDTAVLCLSELVTNAVIHTGASSEVRALLEDGILTVLVRDRGSHSGARPTEPRHDDDADPLRVHGRGLQLVSALTSRWGSELDEVGTTVWFVLDPPTGA
ncbi:ATP-binding protein [Nocardioides sp.]|uniref:ATP-binding protein n=1 Tax=Nocardioides sp. TaxID=35761 RepID=UPI00271E3B5C|nr:ATP-binding protein [Nocardioides sp.]MDO9454648.1 ATP-binding protein [Nocardioides sp.]